MEEPTFFNRMITHLRTTCKYEQFFISVIFYIFSVITVPFYVKYFHIFFSWIMYQLLVEFFISNIAEKFFSSILDNMFRVGKWNAWITIKYYAIFLKMIINNNNNNTKFLPFAKNPVCFLDQIIIVCVALVFKILYYMLLELLM